MTTDLDTLIERAREWLAQRQTENLRQTQALVRDFLAAVEALQQENKQIVEYYGHRHSNDAEVSETIARISHEEMVKARDRAIAAESAALRALALADMFADACGEQMAKLRALTQAAEAIVDYRGNKDYDQDLLELLDALAAVLQQVRAGREE